MHSERTGPAPGRQDAGTRALLSSPARRTWSKSASLLRLLRVSTLISGPMSFRFVGFRAMTEKDVGLTYTRQATRVIEGLPEDGIPTVMAGDFNASKSPAHLRNVERLASRGLVSAYHAHHGVEHRSTEEHPTSFHMWQQTRPFHMDFVFVPREWRIDAVDVGLFEDFSYRGGSSDHVPVVVTIGGIG